MSLVDAVGAVEPADLSLQPPERRRLRDYDGDQSTVLRSLVSLPASLGGLEELAPRLSDALLGTGHRSQLGILLNDHGALRLADGSFGQLPNSTLATERWFEASQPLDSTFLAQGRAMTWNILSETAPLRLSAELGLRRILGVPLQASDRIIGVLLIADKPTPYTEGDLRWADSLASSVATTVDLACRLHKCPAAGAEHRMWTAAEVRQAERTSLAEQLHDSALPLLFGAEAILNSLSSTTDMSEALNVDRLMRARTLVQQASGTLRDMVLERFQEPSQLAERLRALPATFRQAFDTPVDVDVSSDAEEVANKIRPKAAAALTRIAHEATLNSLKHAGASVVSVSLLRTSTGGLQVVVADDGVGLASPHRSKGCFGLASLQRTIEGCSGTLRIESTPKSGTRVIAEIGP